MAPIVGRAQSGVEHFSHTQDTGSISSSWTGSAVMGGALAQRDVALDDKALIVTAELPGVKEDKPRSRTTNSRSRARRAARTQPKEQEEGHVGAGPSGHMAHSCAP